MDVRENPRIPILAGIGAAAAAAFVALATVERDRRLSKKDRKALAKIARRFAKHERAARLLHPLGKWWAYVPAAAVAAGAIYAKGSGRQSERAAGAAAVLLAAGASAVAGPLFDKLLPQPPLPPGHKADPKPTFPSGHAFGLGAVALTIAYIFHREGLIGPEAAVPIALLPPLIGGVAKMIERRHWPSEVAGGLLVAVAIASWSALVYELERGGRQA